MLRRLVIMKALSQRDIDRAYNLAGVIIGMLTSAIIRLKERDN